MTVQVAFLWLAEILMFLALACFVRGFRLRKNDRRRHMFYGRLGAIIVYTGIGALEFCIRVLGWEFPVRDETVLACHISVASLSLALLTLLWITGAMRILRIHTRLYLLFFPSYVATLILSFLAFELW